MHVIVRQGNGKYYVSTVFGYYNDIKSDDDYQRYLESIHTPYYVVWDEEKKRLIKWFAMQPNTRYLIPQILVVDSDRSDWIMDEEGIGGVAFLPRKLADEYIEKGTIPEDIYEKCLEAGHGYSYNAYPEIITDKDIEDLDWLSRGFHDAFIKEERMQDDGKLYLMFEGLWGCSIEIWFWGDLEYDTSSRNPEEYDPYWYSSTVIRQDGFIYFVDEDAMTVDKITNEYCWFKARHMQYHVIPD